MDFSALIDAVTSFFSSCFGDITTILLALANWFFAGLVYVIAYPSVLCVEGVLGAVSTIISALDMSAFVVDWAGNLLSLPGPMLYLLHACGFDTGLSIVAAAIVIRMVINLIPGAVTRI